VSSNSPLKLAEKRALKIKEFCEAYGPSRSTTYKLINEGKLKSVLVGGRRLILVESAEALLKGAA
jgi:excisionase family DNA binding protein